MLVIHVVVCTHIRVIFVRVHSAWVAHLWRHHRRPHMRRHLVIFLDRHRVILALILACFGPHLLLAVLLGEHDFFHLLNRYGTLDVDPLILNHMLHLQLQDKVDAANVAIGHEAETTRLIRPLVLQNDAVLDLAKVSKVAPKVDELQVVREPTDEDFAQLRVNLIATVLGLLPELLYGGELFLVFHNLLV